MPVSPIPPGYHAVTPYLIVEGGIRALAWYAEAFGARELMRLPMPGDKIGHAEIEIGDSRIMLADEVPAHDAKAPSAFGGSPVSLHLYVMKSTLYSPGPFGRCEDKIPARGKFYCDRLGSLLDPFGHTWHIATHIEDITNEEIQRRMATMLKQD